LLVPIEKSQEAIYIKLMATNTCACFDCIVRVAELFVVAFDGDG